MKYQLQVTLRWKCNAWQTIVLVMLLMMANHLAKAQIQQPKTASEYVVQGIRHQTNGDLESAIQSFTKAISLDPEDAGAYVMRGGAYHRKGDHDRAIEDFTKAISLNPKFGLAYSGRARTYHTKGEYDRAIEDFNQAISLNPRNAIAYYGRGRVYYDKSDFERAIRDYSQAISFEPKIIYYYQERSLAYRALGKNELADADEKKTHELSGSPDPNYNRGLFYLWRREYEQAIQEFTKAISLSSSFALAYNRRGDAYYQKREYDRAIQDYGQAISIDPRFAEAYLNRGLAYHRKGEYDRAIQDFSQAISIDPRLARTYILRGMSYSALGKNELADADRKKAQELSKQQADDTKQAGQLAAEQKKSEGLSEQKSSAVTAQRELQLNRKIIGNGWELKVAKCLVAKVYKPGTVEVEYWALDGQLLVIIVFDDVTALPFPAKEIRIVEEKTGIRAMMDQINVSFGRLGGGGKSESPLVTPETQSINGISIGKRTLFIASITESVDKVNIRFPGTEETITLQIR